MSRQLNKTLEQCKAIKLQLEMGLSVFLATEKEKTAKKYTNILASLGIIVTVEPQYTQPDKILMFEDDRMGTCWHISQKILTGYLIKKK